MRQALCILVLGLVFGIAFNQFSPTGLSWSFRKAAPVAGESTEITLEEARALHDRGEAVFLDARDPASFREAHIPGALNINSDNLSINLPFLQDLSKSGKAIITYCDGIDCPLGGELARNLRNQGIRDVKVLAKGLSFWAEAKYPVDRETR